MERKEKQYVVTEIKKCDKKLKENKVNIILCTIFAIGSVLGLTIASNVLLVKIIGMLLLSGSSFTMGFSIFERPAIKEDREKLINKIKFDKIKNPTKEDIDFGLDQPNHVYYKK